MYNIFLKKKKNIYIYIYIYIKNEISGLIMFLKQNKTKQFIIK